AVAAKLIGDIPIAAHLLGGLWIFLAGCLTYSLFRTEFGSVAAAATSCFLVYVLGSNMTWGLEMNLFFFLLVAYVWMESMQKNPWIILGLLVLARPDGALLVLIHIVRSENRPGLIKGMITVAAIVVPWLVFSAIWFGELLPRTLHSKLWQG